MKKELIHLPRSERKKIPRGISFSIIVMMELGKLTWNVPINWSIHDYLSIQEDVNCHQQPVFVLNRFDPKMSIHYHFFYLCILTSHDQNHLYFRCMCMVLYLYYIVEIFWTKTTHVKITIKLKTILIYDIN